VEAVDEADEDTGRPHQVEEGRAVDQGRFLQSHPGTRVSMWFISIPKIPILLYFWGYLVFFSYGYFVNQSHLGTLSANQIHSK
jgi:hypothetical protein